MSQNLLVVYSSYTSLYSLVLNLNSAPPTCSQNLVWASSSLLTISLSCSPKFRTRRRQVAQHIHWGQSPTLIQVLFLGLSLQVYIRLVRISTPSKLCLSSLQVASQLNNSADYLEKWVLNDMFYVQFIWPHQSSSCNNPKSWPMSMSTMWDPEGVYCWSWNNCWLAMSGSWMDWHTFTDCLDWYGTQGYLRERGRPHKYSSGEHS